MLQWGPPAGRPMLHNHITQHLQLAVYSTNVHTHRHKKASYVRKYNNCGNTHWTHRNHEWHKHIKPFRSITVSHTYIHTNTQPLLSSLPSITPSLSLMPWSKTILVQGAVVRHACSQERLLHFRSRSRVQCLSSPSLPVSLSLFLCLCGHLL